MRQFEPIGEIGDAERERRRLSRFGDMMLDGEIGREDYDAKRAELKDRIEAIEGGRSRLRAREERAHAILDERLATAANAASYEEYDKPGRRAMARSLGAQHCLTLGRVDIRLGPVMQKIAGLEPPRAISESLKHGDPVPCFAIWQGYLEATLQAARLEADEEETEMERRADAARSRKRPERREPTKRNRPPEGGQPSGAA